MNSPTRRIRSGLFLVLLIFVLAALIAFVHMTQRYEPPGEISTEQRKGLSEYLRSHWMSPVEYVVSKFEDHDIVLLGEFHRIKHEVVLVQNLIPALYKAGIYNLGIEFGNHDLQPLADSIVTAPQYHEKAVQRMMFRWSIDWGYREYMDLYRKAWELNHSLPGGAPRFRIVNLDYRPHWPDLGNDMTDEQWRKVWYKGDRDRFMAAVAMKEFINQGKKALIYCGMNHSFTRYRQPFYNFKTHELSGLNNSRLGNILYGKIGDRALTILLHSPWHRSDKEKLTYPVGGAIDRVMEDFPHQAVAFDTQGTPFGALADSVVYYSIGYDNFALGTICDGYIYQKPFREYEGCTLDRHFLTSANIEEARAYSPTLLFRTLLRWPWVGLFFMNYDANPKHFFRHLMK